MPASWYVGSDWTARIAPKQHNPLAFQWQDQPFEIRSILLSAIDDGWGLSLPIDIGETMDNSLFPVPLFTYRNFPRHEGLTVEQSLASLDRGVTADMGVQIPETLTPMRAKTVIASALGYFVFPLDAIPDFTPVVGFADDLGALMVAAAVIAAHIKPKHRQQARQKLREYFGNQGDTDDQSGQPASSSS